MPLTIPYSELIIPANRQRQDFDPEALVDLGNSIASKGLMHPIVVRETAEGYALVAGERRLRAMMDLWAMGDGVRCNGALCPPETVPIVTLGSLSPIDAEEAELDENLKRRDLTWQEQSSAIARLHALRVQQATAIGEKHRLADTMSELSETTGASGLQISQSDQVSKAILLADHLDNPLVSGAKSVSDAFKALRKEEDRKKSIALGEAVGKNYNSSVHKLHNVNCLEWLETCPDNSFDVILTDPPYGMTADQFGDGAGKLTNSTHVYDDSPEAWRTLLTTFAPEAYRVAKPQAHAYIFCDLDRFHELKSVMEAAEWYVFRTPLIVYKPSSGRVPLPEQGPRRQYELILYAIKGWKPVTGIYSDVIPCRLEENLTHGANKPVELFVNLLKRSVRPGDTVLDAFAGSGTIFPAAHECKVYATGLELSPEYYGISVKRLNALDEEPTLV